MGYRAEIWTRPGASTFTHVDTIDSPILLGATRRGGGLGEGNLSLAADLDATRLNSILFADKDAPANDVTALIRYYRDGQTSGEDAPFFEWLADGRVPPATVTQPNLNVSGLDMNSLFGWGTVEAWDWDGSADWQTSFPDWIWGGRNLLGVLEGRYKPEVVTLTITATAGTVTMTVTNDSGSDTTDPVAFGATASTWKLELQDLSNVTLVDVSGPAGGPFRITFTDTNANTVVGGSAGTAITTVQQGAIVPVGYEPSRSYVSDLPHGVLVEYRMWETGDPALPAGCDTAVMFNGTEPDYPGFQKRVKVRPGGVYQIASKVTSTQAGDDVRMVVRDLAENEINGAGNARDDQTITVAGTFQDFEIVNLVMPLDVDEVILRWGHSDEDNTDPGRIFVACPEFTEGLAADTIGAILTALYDDAQTDHAGDGREVWGSTPFLELDFDGTNDSGGNAWAEAEVSVRFNLNTSYSLVLAEIGRRGYEWRIIPKQQKTANPADDGVWLLQVFNPDTAGTDYSAASDPAILSGTDVVARAARMFAPSATMVRVQGADGYTSRTVSAAAVGALGRREAGVQSPDLFSLLDTAAVSSAELADRLTRAESISPTVRPIPGEDPVPGADFDVFDNLNVADVPYVQKADRRLAAWTATFTPEIPEGEFLLSFTAETFVGQSAVNAGVRRLLRDFEAIRQQPQDQPGEAAPFVGEGKIPWLVAASTAPDEVKRTAGFICDGADDAEEVNRAFELFNQVDIYGELKITVPDGGTAITVPAGKTLRGVHPGEGSSILQDDSPSGVTSLSSMVTVEALASLVDIAVYADSWELTDAVVLDGSGQTLRGLAAFAFEGAALRADGNDNVVVEGSWFENVGDADVHNALAASGACHSWRIANTTFRGGGRAVVVDEGLSTNWSVTGCYIGDCGGDAWLWNGGTSGRMMTMVGNTFSGWGQDVASIEDAAAIRIVGDGVKVVTDDGGDEWDPLGLVNSNTFDGLYPGIIITGHMAVHMVGNVHFRNACAVLLDDTDECVIADAMMLVCGSPSASDDLPAVLIRNDSNTNKVMTSRMGTNEEAGPQPDHAIIVEDADCDGNIIVGNDLRGRGFPWTVSPIDDQGTGTLLDWPDDPTYGDNFVDPTSPTSP